MNLNDLKPAWKQFRLLNSMSTIRQSEILAIIEQEDLAVSKLHRWLINLAMFLALVICCQGG